MTAPFLDSQGTRDATQPASNGSSTRRVTRISVLLLAALTLVGTLVARIQQPALAPPTAEQTALARTRLAARRTVETGTFLSVGVDGPAAQTLGLGFLHPDASGAWMGQLSANLQFAVAAGVTPVSIELEIRPLVAASERDRKVTVSSSIDEVVMSLTGGREPVLVALDGNTEQVLTISCDKVDSPIGLKLGPDRRAFCAFLIGYSIKAEGT